MFGHRVYHGLHHLCPQPARYFTFLRNPIERVISLYNYHCDIATDPSHQLHQRDRGLLCTDKHLISFEDWYQQYYSGNHLVRFLYYAMRGELVDQPHEMERPHLDAALEFLNQCWFIGFTETSASDIPTVCHAVGVPVPKSRANVSRNHLTDSARLRAASLIEQTDAIDLELYHQARKLRGA